MTRRCVGESCVEVGSLDERLDSVEWKQPEALSLLRGAAAWTSRLCGAALKLSLVQWGRSSHSGPELPATT